MDNLLEVKEENKKLLKYVRELLDYCISLRAATKYYPPSSPNLEAILREVNKLELGGIR